MTTKTAAIFPGQGTQQPGMGKWMDVYPAASRVFDQAEALGFPARAVCFEADANALKQTETAQPALFTVGVAAYQLLLSNGAEFQAAAGHSLGEYAALYAAGIVSFQDALRLVMERGRLMAKAAKENPGGMSAVIGLEDEAVEAVCAEASQGADAVSPLQLQQPRASRHFRFRFGVGTGGSAGERGGRPSCRSDTCFRRVPFTADAFRPGRAGS